MNFGFRGCNETLDASLMGREKVPATTVKDVRVKE
jgi:hypothetical protein